MTAYYNEIDPKAAAWLRELIKGGHIAAGDVDERSIEDVKAEDLEGYTQCHFFAGIGGWSLALRLAGWPDDAPVWTGSCPCQPFSAAGKQQGAKDARHLWPEFFRLIKGGAPPVVFGEQVASSEVVGTSLEASFLVAVQREDFARANLLAKRLHASRSFHYWPRWVDGVQADLAREGYAFGFKVLGAHSVGAPHIRQRLWWVADGYGGKPGDRGLQPGGQHGQQSEDEGIGGRVADGMSTGRAERRPGAGRGPAAGVRGVGGVGDAGSERRQQERRGAPCDEDANGRRTEGRHKLTGSSEAGGMADAEHAERRSLHVDREDGHDREDHRREEAHGEPRAPGEVHGLADDKCDRRQQGPEMLRARQSQPAEHGEAGFWDTFDLIPCRDGKWRRVGPGLFPLAHGVPARVGKLRGYGNAIPPQVAAAYITAWLEDRARVGADFAIRMDTANDVGL